MGWLSDVLIHEATFDDSLAADALAKRHSTTHEAVDVARRMRARVTILTHLSQRYAKVPVFDFDHAPATAIAFDQMCVRRPSLHHACSLALRSVWLAIRPSICRLSLPTHLRSAP
jgi:ribonuclease Z